MTVVKNEESRGKGFLNSTAKVLGFNPLVGFHSHLLTGSTKLFGMLLPVGNPPLVTGKGLAPLDFSSPLWYSRIEMRGNNRGYRGRRFHICDSTLHKVNDAQERYRGILEFKNGGKRQFVSYISNLREEVEYELYAGGLDSRPTTETVIRVVEVQEVSER